MSTEKTIKHLALSGGVGGAKLVSGLSRIIPEGELLVAANTGDDFTHMGLHISPDIDSIFYAVTDLNNTETGWGRVNETWNFMEAVKGFGGENWFNLGDRDLAMHVMRSDWLRQGYSLSDVTDKFCTALKVNFKLAPMSDNPVATMIETDQGMMAMQDYFVRERCAPIAKSFTYEGASTACTNPAILKAFNNPDLQSIIICPSNPYLSIDPILALADIRAALHQASVPVIAVSPIVGGAALKGPLGKIMTELGLEPSSLNIAKHYGELIDVLIIDQQDAPEKTAIEQLGIQCITAPSIMETVDDQKTLAHFIIENQSM